MHPQRSILLFSCPDVPTFHSVILSFLSKFSHEPPPYLQFRAFGAGKGISLYNAHFLCPVLYRETSFVKNIFHVSEPSHLPPLFHMAQFCLIFFFVYFLFINHYAAFEKVCKIANAFLNTYQMHLYSLAACV